jgi:hypothetical protein
VVGGGCSYAAAPDFGGCDDKNQATTPDFCIQSKCVGGTRFDPSFKPICGIQGLTPVSATVYGGSHLVVANYKAQTFSCTSFPTFSCSCSTTYKDNFSAYAIEPGGTLYGIGAATGSASAIGGAVVVGAGGIMGIVSADLQKLDFDSTTFHDAVADATSVYKDVDWRAVGTTSGGGLFYSEEWFLMSGRIPSTSKGFALRCVRNTDSFEGKETWSCGTTKLPTTPPVNEQDWRGATLWSEVTSCTNPPCFAGSTVGGGILASTSTDLNLDVSIDAEGDNTFPNAQATYTGSASLFRGIVQLSSSEAWIYGSKGTMTRCNQTSCKEYAPIGTATVFHDAVSMGGAFVALAKDATGWMITGFPAGANGEDGKAWFRFDLPVDTEIPMAITGSLSTGITVVGTTKDQNNYVLWRFIP